MNITFSERNFLHSPLSIVNYRKHNNIDDQPITLCLLTYEHVVGGFESVKVPYGKYVDIVHSFTMKEFWNVSQTALIWCPVFINCLQR